MEYARLLSAVARTPLFRSTMPKIELIPGRRRRAPESLRTPFANPCSPSPPRRVSNPAGTRHRLPLLLCARLPPRGATRQRRMPRRHLPPLSTCRSALEIIKGAWLLSGTHEARRGARSIKEREPGARPLLVAAKDSRQRLCRRRRRRCTGSRRAGHRCCIGRRRERLRRRLRGGGGRPATKRDGGSHD